MFVNPGLDPTSGAGGLATAGEAMPEQPGLDPSILNASMEMQDDGSAVLTPGEDDEPPAVRDVPHDGNLAEVLDEHTLNMLASDVIEGVEADIDSNSEWFEQITEGLKLLGLKPGERIDMPYEGAPAATHPLLKEAAIRFAATASGEMMPAAGPVRCMIHGDSTPDQEKKAQRKQGFMNFYLTQEDEDYYDDVDQMLLVMGLHGHVYRKVWRDPIRGGVPTSRFFSAWDVIVSARATTMSGSYPVTQIEPIPRGDMLALQRQAWYRDVDLQEPADDMTQAREAKAAAGWVRPTDLPDDIDHVVYHRHCMLDLAGAEHVDADGKETGLPLPYIVTVERDSQKVLRVARNWDERDPLHRPRAWFVPFRFMPGLTFMGWGLIHLVGSDTDTLTVMQRQALTSFAFASFPGGLKRRGTKTEDTTMRIAPGEFKDIETGGAPIGDAVMALPYKDMPASYPVLNQSILQNAQRVAGTSDIAVGDARDDALPGTVIALMKQATQLQSAVLKRLHRAQRKEFRMLADLIGLDGRKTYPYVLNGVQGMALAEDFAENEDVSPVADPNLPTQTERLANAQASLSIAQQLPPGMVDVKAAAEDMYRIMGKTDAELARLMPPPQPPQPGQPMDPVSEFVAAQKGAPLAAGPMQDHSAHIQAHMGQLAIPGVEKSPVGAALHAHIGEHVALAYVAQATRATGMPMVPGQPMPPEMEARIAAAVAAASETLKAAMAQIVPDPKAGMDPNKAAEIEVKKAALVAGQMNDQRKAQAAARQDQGEAFKQQAVSADNAADREAELEGKRLDIMREQVKAQGALAVAQARGAGGPR